MIIQKNFLADNKRIALRDHAMRLYKNGLMENNYTQYRYILPIYNTPHANAIVKSVEAPIRGRLRAFDVQPDPLLGWVISLIKPGGRIHMHRDNCDHYSESGRQHLRCNVVVSKNPDSGNPIVEDQTYVLREGDLWAFFAHSNVHGCEVVDGKKPRIIYQFGYSVAVDKLEDLSACFAADS